MYRSFILGLLLSFGIMVGVGFWLTSGRDAKKNVAPATAAAEVSPPAPPARLERPVPATARGVLVGQLPVEVRAPRPALALTRLGGDPDLEAAIAGAVDKERIRTAIKSVKPLVNQCFRDVQKRHPPPQKVVLSFTLRGGGFTEGKLVESTIADPWVEACVLDSLQDARFPASPDAEALTLTYPFRFEQDAG